ncbi:LA_2478/LA_2722/LA_4182 family protein [Spirochaetota bacterium]
MKYIIILTLMISPVLFGCQLLSPGTVEEFSQKVSLAMCEKVDLCTKAKFKSMSPEMRRFALATLPTKEKCMKSMEMMEKKSKYAKTKIKLSLDEKKIAMACLKEIKQAKCDAIDRAPSCKKMGRLFEKKRKK